MISYFLILIILLQKESNDSNEGNLYVDDKYLEEEDEDLDEARSLTARYVQRSPSVPIKVNHKKEKD